MRPLNLGTNTRKREVGDLQLGEDSGSACWLEDGWGMGQGMPVASERWKKSPTDRKDTGTSILQMQESETYQQERT